MNNFSERVSFIWQVADLLRGPYRPNQYKDVMLPMTVLRRLDCVLESTKKAVLEKYSNLQGGKVTNLEPILNKVAGQSFNNTSKFTFEKLKGDPNNIGANLTNYIKGFSSKARSIIDNFGSLLFLLHMISKMKPLKQGGTRLAIVFNGSPLFTGSAGSGESEIRRWVIENDLLEAIVALPDQLFYNTGIFTYLWILSNRKSKERKGKIQLINATSFFNKMRKSLGNKRNEITEVQRDEITRLYGEFKEGEFVKIFDNEDFGYSRVTVERPLKLSFSATDEKLIKLQTETAFINLASSKKRKDAVGANEEIQAGKVLQTQILSCLETLKPLGIVKNREAFLCELKTAFKAKDLKLSAQIVKSILTVLSDKDETADICLDSNGSPEPDSDLRDYENIPLKQGIQEYMSREVLPHVPSAWIDESKTKIGYEVNFNRYFYKYVPPRPLEVIEAELLGIEREIAEMLGGR